MSREGVGGEGAGKRGRGNEGGEKKMEVWEMKVGGVWDNIFN